MCLGIPMQIVTSDGAVGTATDGHETVKIDLALTGPLEPGTWVLNFLGAARDVLDPDEAQKIRAALAGLQSLMNGGDLGDAFADLEAREPELPPHLRDAANQRKANA